VIALSFVTFFLGVAVGGLAVWKIHIHAHPDCPGSPKDTDDPDGP